MLDASRLDIEIIWKEIEAHQGRVLYTKSGLPFAYTVKEKSIFIDRKKKTITKSTIEKAVEKLKEQGEAVTGPKSLGMFGAPYIWAIFMELKLV